MSEKYGGAALREILQTARIVLNRKGLPMVQSESAFRFCLALARAVRRARGERLVLEVKILVLRWQQMGVDPELMRELVREVFRVLKRQEPLERWPEV